MTLNESIRKVVISKDNRIVIRTNDYLFVNEVKQSINDFLKDVKNELKMHDTKLIANKNLDKELFLREHRFDTQEIINKFAIKHFGVELVEYGNL